MRIIDFDEEYIGFVSTCTHSMSNQLDGVAKERANWIRTNLNRGLKIKIAIAEDRPLGFAHCIPIELGAWEIAGRDLMAIPCLTVCYDRVYGRKTGSGVGKALVQSVEDEARKSASGVVALCFDHEFWFMPFSFFRKLGYQDAGRRGNKVIALKSFTPVDPPCFTELCHEPKLIPGKVIVDAFWQCICPTAIEEMRTIRTVCAEFGERVALHEINTTNPNEGSKYPVSRALFVNGSRVVFDDAGSPDAIREAISTELEKTRHEPIDGAA